MGVLMVCLAIPATLVSAQAPAPEAVPDPGQTAAPGEPAEAPAPQSPPSELPPSTETPEPGTTAPPVPAEPEEPPPPPPPVADSPTTVSAGKTASVAILDGNSQSDYVFSPASLTVSAGDTVAWTNNGNQPHDVTGSGLSSGTLQSGQGYSHTFASAGNFSYICSIHPFMKGSVTVQASSGGAGVSDPEAAPNATAPSSESSAVASPDAAGTGTQLPSTGMPVWPLLAAGGGLVLAGALLRRRAPLS